MPPKKKENNCTDKPVVELQADHELFLQAFESKFGCKFVKPKPNWFIRRFAVKLTKKKCDRLFYDLKEVVWKGYVFHVIKFCNFTSLSLWKTNVNLYFKNWFTL